MTSRAVRPTPVRRACSRLVAAVALLFAATLPSMAQQNPRLAITAPGSGTVVKPGQSIAVTVASPSGQAFEGVMLMDDCGLGVVATSLTLPARFTVDIPANAALGSFSLSAVAGGAGFPEPVVASIEISVERPDLPTVIRADIAQVVFTAQGQDWPIKLRATFSEGAVVDVTASSNVTFVSSNPKVAIVDAFGTITGVGAGVAEVTATYAVSSETRRALVRVIVPAPPYTVTPNILDFGEHEVGTTTRGQMTLTNSSGRPLTITDVAASSDFVATRNCVAPSPMEENATCTIVVTFTPQATGLREGVLQISEPDDRVRFRLKGTGVRTRR